MSTTFDFYAVDATQILAIVAGHEAVAPAKILPVLRRHKPGVSDQELMDWFTAIFAKRAAVTDPDIDSDPDLAIFLLARAYGRTIGSIPVGNGGSMGFTEEMIEAGFQHLLSDPRLRPQTDSYPCFGLLERARFAQTKAALEALDESEYDIADEIADAIEEAEFRDSDLMTSWC